MKVWDAVPPDNDVGEILRISTSFFMMDWNVVLPENNVEVEVLADIGIALHGGLECGSTR